jgi:hypothetical protein
MTKKIFSQLLSMAAIAALVVFIPACSEDKKADYNNSSTTSDAVKRAADSTDCLAYSHSVFSPQPPHKHCLLPVL